VGTRRYSDSPLDIGGGADAAVVTGGVVKVETMYASVLKVELRWRDRLWLLLPGRQSIPIPIPTPIPIPEPRTRDCEREAVRQSIPWSTPSAS